MWSFCWAPESMVNDLCSRESEKSVKWCYNCNWTVSREKQFPVCQACVPGLRTPILCKEKWILWFFSPLTGIKTFSHHCLLRKELLGAEWDVRASYRFMLKKWEISDSSYGFIKAYYYKWHQPLNKLGNFLPCCYHWEEVTKIGNSSHLLQYNFHRLALLTTYNLMLLLNWSHLFFSNSLDWTELFTSWHPKKPYKNDVCIM